jgi:bacteriocin biosynthesis cyclodehydratase domain-containing protein
VRPALKAGLRPVWRDRETVQIGIDPRRAVALTGMGDAAAVLGLLDGSRDRDQVVTAARAQGVPAPVTERILALLAAGGVLDDFPAAALAALPQDQRRRLGAELATAALARGYSDAGAAVLARRDAARVQIYGPGRIAAALADILTTSGVGRVTTCDDVRLPAGATGAATAQADGSHGSWRRDGRPVLPDLAILVGYQQPELAGWLMRAGVAHLAVTAEEAIGIVGPMVRPGQTSCLRCLHLTRSDLDPAWPLILAQLVGRTTSPAACDAALAAAVAAQAAGQVLAHLDRDPAPTPAENGTLELELPGWQWHRRTWPPHPACACIRPR